MPKFRKKPVVIEAVLWTGDNFHEVARLAGSPANVAHRYAGLPVENVTQYIEKVENGVLQVETLEGTMKAIPGDYIIKGVKGELYPCKPVIFAATYEDADSPTYDGAARIAAERRRQIEEEGFRPEIDEQYIFGQLVAGGISYAGAAFNLIHHDEQANATQPESWPWDEAWWKPSPDPIRNLEKAGALIAAEIDRLLWRHGGE